MVPNNGTLTLEDSGAFMYEPDADFNGTDTFTYYVTDGELSSATATVTITVNTVNDTPVAAEDAYPLDEDNTLTVNAADGVLANDTDADGDALEAAIYSGPSHGAISFDVDGSFEYTPDEDYYGTDTFIYYVGDSFTSSWTTVTITVNSVNDAPLAEADAYTTDEDVDLTVDIDGGVLANDTDDGAHIAVLVDGPANGTLTLEDSGAFTYEPDDDCNGTDTFTYYVTDGEFDSETVTVTITMKSVNDLPSVTDDALTLSAVEAVDIDVLDNDTDADTDDMLSIASFDATSQEGADVTLNFDGTLHYDPTVSSSLFGGTATSDSFTYTITDGHTGTSVTGTVTITIDESAETYITLSGNSISVTGGGATVNGTTVTVTSARTYRISGTLNDGQVIVDTDDKEDVILVLNGANITCSDSAPICVVNASNTVITLVDDTQNYVTDDDDYTFDAGTNESDAAVFSNDDLVFNGSGSLTVDANFNHGISSSGDLDINAGNITVNAVNHGIRGKDSVVILDGTVTVVAGGDGINIGTDDPFAGNPDAFFELTGGYIAINAQGDGCDSYGSVYMRGGTMIIHGPTDNMNGALD